MTMVLAIALTLCVLLTACGKKTDSPASADKPTEPTTTTTTAAPTTTTKAPETTTAPTEPEQPDAPETPDEPEQPEQPEQPGTPDTPDEPETPSANSVAALAQEQIGKPFVYGKAGPDEFDNSGLAYYCLTKNGISVPRRTGEQFRGGTAIAESDLTAGDLVFYWMETEGAAQYVGVYIGDGKFVAANNEDNPVRTYDMSMPYFQARFVGAVRYN